MQASKNGDVDPIPTTKQKGDEKTAANLEHIDKNYNQTIVIPKAKLKNGKAGKNAKVFKKAANNGRFSMIELADVTTIDDFKSQVAKVLKPLNNNAFKKNNVLMTKDDFSNDWDRSYENIGSSDNAYAYFIDLNDLVAVGTALRRLLLKMTFTLSDMSGGSDYQNMLVNAYMSLNTASANYQDNLADMVGQFTYEASWRDDKADSCWTADGASGYRTTIYRINDCVAAIKAHSKTLRKVVLDQTASNFRSCIDVISKAGLRHGSEVANSHRSEMNKMMNKFDKIVKNMNSDFEKRLKNLNTKWELKYNAMESRLMKEIGRLEDVIVESERLNEEYSTNLESLLSRVEKLNLSDRGDRNKANMLNVKSEGLFKNNMASSASFKANKDALAGVNVNDIKLTDEQKASKSNTKTYVAIAGGVAVVASAAAFFVPKAITKSKGEANGSRSR